MIPVTLTPISEVLVAVERGFPAEPGVRALVLCGERYTIVFDTLYSPLDMVGVLELAGQRRRPLLVINSHADLDHAWGNAAFPGIPIIGHASCRERMLGMGSMLEAEQLAHPEEFATTRLWPPDLTFTRTMSIDAGGFSVILHHLPGHQRDTIVAHVPEHGLLLGGDCVETPIPLLNTGPLDAWAGALRVWAAEPSVHTVIPSHGPISGKELLEQNATYLESLLAGRDDGWLPDSRSLPFYVEAHARNVAAAAALRDGLSPD